ncbi:hypothetical protein AWW67_03515 [Roseivirga seohaensis]|uniref:Lipoprotein n=1 Tax=Roseivirga seohaensis TaxID=1914963 RepID=A0A150XZH3_9BACT|nr:DUF4221 family protein [Roseivirga seohaensis]KYG84190.1 hypothetical protein AWW67_03515 [Roseivirga seohaensis]
MRYNPIKTLLVVLLLSSCGGTEKSEKTDNIIAERKPLELIDKGIKSFPLDHETDFQWIKDPSIFQKNGKEYLTFYNRPNHSIYLYDYDSAQLFKKVTLSEQGPNTVPKPFRFKYLIHSMDSIFVQIPYSGIYLINNQAEVIHRLVSNGEMTFSQRRAERINTVSLDEASTYKKGMLSVANNNQINQPNRPFVRAFVNWEIGSITSDFIRPESFITLYEEIQAVRNTKGKTIMPLPKHFAADDQYVYATTPISDSIYVFAGNELVKPIYAGVPSETITDYKSYMPLRELIIESSGGSGSVSGPSKMNQPPFFTNLYISPNHKYLYRILSHGTKPAINLTTNIEYAAITSATLLVLDLTTEETTSIELPIGELKLYVPTSSGVFANNAGLHIQVKDQQNEDEIQFRVFGVK